MQCRKMAENNPIAANRSCGYCLEFDVGKKKNAAPKCVLEYCSKPWPSEALLREKQHKAALRRKREEQARLERIHVIETAAMKLEEKLRPYLETLEKQSVTHKDQ